MSLLRKILSWLFGLQAVAGLVSYVILPGLYYWNDFAQRDPFQILRMLAFTGIYVGSAAVFAIAWWAAQRSSRSCRAWSLAASTTNLLMWVPELYFVPRVHWGNALPVSIWLHVPVGIAGLIAFWRIDKNPQTSKRADEGVRLSSDGTKEWINKIAGYLVAGGGLGAFFWWQYWFYTKHIPFGDIGILRTVFSILLAGFAAIAVLQVSNTVVGLALGKEVHSFAIGPLLWNYRGGRYEFQFVPAGFLSLGGVSSFLPANSAYSPTAEVVALAAGPAAALSAGLIALWIAFSSEPDSPLQVGGYVAFFGAICLVVSAALLIPYRKGGSYSPGALIIQILRGGPLAELHATIAEVTSSIMGPMRPKNYNIGRIQRVAGIFTFGIQGLLLRLWAFDYFLDCGRNSEAADALLEAESICHNSALDIPAELHTVFVFGNAYLRHDARAAREWWERMQAKKPTRMDVDYWRAKSALHWIEGDLLEANEALKRMDALAQRLPHAGGYEYDRYCCDLLRRSIDDAPEEARGQ